MEAEEGSSSWGHVELPLFVHGALWPLVLVEESSPLVQPERLEPATNEAGAPDGLFMLSEPSLLVYKAVIMVSVRRGSGEEQIKASACPAPVGGEGSSFPL